MSIQKIYTLSQGTKPTSEVIASLLGSSELGRTRSHYDKLYKYYMSEPIASRRSPHDLRLVVNHARYITKTNVGYLLGNPVNYLATEGIDITPITNQYRRQTISNLDVELANDASIFGHAFERIFVDEESNPRSARISPRNCSIVYDDTVKHNKLFALIVESQDDRAARLTILTPESVIEGALVGKNFQKTDERPHSYGDVPVVEYLNNSDRMGDFEPIISLLDAYNILQSDRVIDRERLVDAILAFYGVAFTSDQQKQLKDSRMISNLPAGSKLEYVVKNINEADADVLRKTLAADIHKISMTPDMSDENFAGNSSGVALLYKLLAFEQHIKDKERYFEKALLERFSLYNSVLNATSNMPIVPVEEIDAVFKRALPQNDYEISQMITNLVGIVDKETLVSRLSFVQDAKETVELASQEKTQTYDYAYNKIESPDRNQPQTQQAETEPVDEAQAA